MSSFEYWRLDSERETVLDDQACAEVFRDELERAVSVRLPADGRVGILLSGGLDSSAIACIAARRVVPERLHALCGVFPSGDDGDEREFQCAVVNGVGAKHHEIDIASSERLEIEGALDVFGEPTLMGGHWLVWPLLQVARRERVATVLTGVDGDRVVSHGQGRLEELAARGEWRAIESEVAARGVKGYRALRALLGKALALRVPTAVAALDRIRVRTRLNRSAEIRLLRPDAVHRTDAMERVVLDEVRPTNAREMHIRALRRGDRTSDLEVFPALVGDEMQIVHPFFDRKLVELCVSLPAEQKVRLGRSRYVLREAMRGILPELVRNRPGKAHFDAPFVAWAAREVQLHDRKNTFDFNNLDPYVRLGVLRSERGTLPMDLVWRCMVVSAWLRGIAAPNSNTGGVPRNSAS